MNIKVVSNTPITDGAELVFRSPVDCSQVTGLSVCYGKDFKEFAFADAHGNDVGNIDHLFTENVVVKVILDVASGMAFVQNADTNAYLEGRFLGIEAMLGSSGGVDSSAVGAILLEANALTKELNDYKSVIDDLSSAVGAIRLEANALTNDHKDYKSVIDDLRKPKCHKAGLIYPLATDVVPKGFLLCDGAEYSRIEYSELFEAIGTTYGAGDGVNTFNVPNLSTRVPVGVGENYPLGKTGGEEKHTLTNEELPSHNHASRIGVYGYSGWPELPIDTYYAMFSNKDSSVFFTPPAEGEQAKVLNVTGAYTGAFTGSTGGNQPHNNMQPYTVVNYIISTGKEVEFAVGVGGESSAGSAVLYTEQALTPEEKTQARENIGAASTAYVYGLYNTLDVLRADYSQHRHEEYENHKREFEEHKLEFDAFKGDISTALDGIIAIQNELIGGDGV